jgi:hypothetical protein
MAYLRLSLIEPKPGEEREARRLLEELDTDLAQAPGLLLSFVVTEERRLGRVSLWRSKADANRLAAQHHTLALRSRLRLIAAERDESLLEVLSGHVPENVAELLEGSARVPRSG